MGADGHIKIWRDDEVREAFADCDALFDVLPSHYADDLDGVKYHHCYWGDNIWVSWQDSDNWYLPSDGVTRERMVEFTEWLSKHGTHWEVWT